VVGILTMVLQWLGKMISSAALRQDSFKEKTSPVSEATFISRLHANLACHNTSQTYDANPSEYARPLWRKLLKISEGHSDGIIVRTENTGIHDYHMWLWLQQ
jgi:hypothetical protein